MDQITAVLDEIALEGLDGITIDGLWLRLSKRPGFVFGPETVNDTKIQEFLWKMVRRIREIEFYKLETPRSQLKISPCYTVDDELGIITETSSTEEDVYPHKLINDTKNGIMGSCGSYDTRVNITSTVRKLDLTDACLYGESLVIVATQSARNKCLICGNMNPNLELSPIQYCILERIGRSRFHGEPTWSKFGLAALGEDSKTIFYYRKYLLQHNFITKQVFQQKSALNNSSGLLLHLPRFFTLVKPKYIIFIENILKILNEQPGRMIEYDVLREQMPGVLKRLTKVVEFQKYLRSDGRLPYRVLYPNADVKQWKQKSTDKEKKIRIVELRNPNADIRELKKRLVNNIEDDEDDDDKVSGILEETNRFIDVPLLTQCAILLKSHGTEGLSQSQIARKLGLSKVQARTITKNIVKTKAAGMYMIDEGRQRITKYYLKGISSAINEHHRFPLKCDTVSDTWPLLENSTTLNDIDHVTSGDDSFVEMKEEPIDGVDECNQYDVSSIEKKLTKRKLSVSKSLTPVKMKKLKSNIDEEEIDSIDRLGTIESFNEFDESLKDSDKFMVKTDETIAVKDAISPNPISDSVESSKPNVNSDVNTTRPPATNDETKRVDISVSIKEDFYWLLPKSTKSEIARIRKKSLRTSRLLKRSNLIMEAVHRMKIITDLKKLVILINESEFKEGLPTRMDKKSLLRILFKLALDKHIKVYRVTLKRDGRVIFLNFICNVNVVPNDPVIKSAIEFNKLKFHTLNATKNSTPISERSARAKVTFEKRNSFSHYPKFNRMKIMHRFLFAMIYDYTGNETLDQGAVKAKFAKEYRLSESDISTFPKLYMSKVDEYMFVPPLPKHNEQGTRLGWCLMSDVLVRMPLSIFLHLVQIPYCIPELDDYMNHPIKKYYLVSDLPTRIHNCITATRKYIFTIYEVMTKLTYIGLLQFGAHHNKEKDQIFAFINRKATLLDTTLSKPGYNKISADIDYPVQKYHFDSLETVDQYWHDCWKICMNTQLGGRSFVLGTDVVFENIQDKQEMMIAVKSREFSEAPDRDTGCIPGDKLGAAGFDSALFAHLKRNWVYKSRQPILYDHMKPLHVRKVSHILPAINRSLKRKLSESHTVVSIKQQNLPNKASTHTNTVCKVNRNRRPNIKVRRINPVKKSLHRKPFYDQIDKEALQQMSKLRVDWTLEEDRILLICKVASAFICPDTRKQVNANMFLAYREVLHKTLQSSKNKTSRACQRRVAYMLRSASMRHNVNLCIEELKRDEYIVEKYGDTLELIREEAKKKGKRIMELGNMWRERFRGLVSDLMDRYNNKSFNQFSIGYLINSKFNEGFLIPDNLIEFHETYSLQHVEKKQHAPKDMFTPVSCENDIYSGVINATIHSTLSCNSDKTSWSYHLFSIYQQYPERILRQTLNRLRENHMVSYKKSYQVRNKSSNNYYLPLSASPYQLSITYVNLIQTRYQSNMYLDSCATFLELMESYSTDRTKDEQLKGYELLSLSGGSTALIAELYSRDVIEFNIDIPNQVIILDPNVQNKDETYSRLVQRYRDVLTNYKKDLTSSVLFQKHNYLSSCSTNDLSLEDDAADEEDIKSVDKNEDDFNPDNIRAMQNVAKAASRIALYMMNDDTGGTSGLVPKEMDHVYDFFVVNSCKLFVKIVGEFTNDVTSPIDDNIIDKTKIIKILQSIRDSSMFRDIDSFEVETPSKEDDEEGSYKLKDFDDAVLDEIIDSNFENYDIGEVKSILMAIKLKNEFGATNNELREMFGNSFKLVEILNKLVELSFVLKTGVVHCRYIYYTFVRPWLLHSFRNLRNDRDARHPMQNIKHFTVKTLQSDFEEICSDDENASDVCDKANDSDIGSSDISKDDLNNDVCTNGTIDESRWCLSSDDLSTFKNSKISEPVRVVMRPWIRIDSTLNRRVLDMMLCSVLSHIMLYPGASLSNIQYRFSPAYQPYHTLEVCDILVKLNCIVRYCVVTKSKPSLFSKPCEVVVEQSTGLESENDIRFEADKFAIINLGKFLDTRPYTKDFISCLIGK